MLGESEDTVVVEVVEGRLAVSVDAGSEGMLSE